MLIVGTGFAGLGMGIRLKQKGIDDFVLIERADDVGGTWRDNSYPGCACDVPSHLYSFSFAPNPEWATTHSSRDDLLKYLRDCADRFDVRSRIRFRRELIDAAWDDSSRRWLVQTTGGSFSAEFLLLGIGPLSIPDIPALPGLERFAGTSFHSAEWNHDHDLSGERVAVIGTGSSAVQFVPAIQPRVGQLMLFQRTPAWVWPRGERRLTKLERRLYRRLPILQRIARTCLYWAHETLVAGFRAPKTLGPIEGIARLHLRVQVRDAELRRKLTPSFRMGCKRVLNSNVYYKALTRANAEVVTDGIAEVRARSIVTEDGTERAVDTIVFGTGFNQHHQGINDLVKGRGGRSLAESWAGVRSALRGTTVAGFPNLFILGGPNTAVGTTSFVFQLEAQIAYVLDALRFIDRRGLATVEPSSEAQEAFNRWLREQERGTVWTSGCQSHYLDENGTNTALWPTFTFVFRHKLRRFDPDEYRLEPASRGPDR